MSGAENPPAFPVAEVRIDGCGISEGYPGMTLRDWFAGQALAGMCSNAALLDGAGTLTQIHAQEAWVTELSFTLADRMLAERSKA